METDAAIRRWMACLTLLIGIALPSIAQTSVVSPEVHSDASVTFRLCSPNAAVVMLELDGRKATPLQKDTVGRSSVVTSSLQPDAWRAHLACLAS